MALRVVGIEDELEWIETIERALGSAISEKQQNRYGIESIWRKVVGSKIEGLQLLKELAQAGTPPDVIIVDLNIPEVPLKDGGVPNNRFGIELLRDARKMFPSAEVLVYSVIDEYELAVDAFSGGAIDFMRKRTVTEEELLARVLAAGARLLARQNANILEQRLKHLVPYAETGLAHRLGVCFSRFVQAVVNETEGLQEGLKERWGLDIERDAHDPQVRHVIEMESAVRQAKKDWTEIVAKLNESNERIADCLVQDALREVKAELRPSLSLNRVILNFDEEAKTYVRTFRNGADDVKAVLREILLGGLSEPLDIGSQTAEDHSSETAEPRPVNVKIDTNNGQAEVRFEDSLTPVDEESAHLINQGLIVPPGKSFGRAWGLSVAQQLAQRGGGKLKIHATGDDNVITYTIPLADPDHEKSAAGR